MNTVDISGLPKAEVLAALFNSAHAAPIDQRLHETAADLTLEKAQALTKRRLVFDYLGDRRLMIYIAGDQLDPQDYDRLNGGDGTAEKAIKRLRETGAIAPERPSQPSKQTADEILEAELDRIAGIHQFVRDTRNRG